MAEHNSLFVQFKDTTIIGLDRILYVEPVKSDNLQEKSWRMMISNGHPMYLDEEEYKALSASLKANMRLIEL